MVSRTACCALFSISLLSFTSVVLVLSVCLLTLRGPLLCAEVKQSSEGGIKLAADSKFSRECVIVGSCEP